MKRVENEIQQMYREHAKTSPQRNLLARIDKLHETLDSLTFRGLSETDRKRLFDEGKEAIARDLMNDLQLEREKIGQELLHVKERYEKIYDAELNKHSFEIAKYERRFRAMDEQELLQTATKYISNEASLPNDPNIVDSLSGELRDRGHTAEFKTLRETAQKRNYNSPHLKTDQAKMLLNQLKLNADVPGGGVLVEFEGEGPAAFGVDALCEGV